MQGIILLATVSLAVLSTESPARAHDIFASLYHGTPCMSPRKIVGCNGTLLTNFEPEDKGTDTVVRDTRFFLFTRKNAKEAEFLHDCGGTLPSNTNFNPNFKTELFVHGYLDGVCVTQWMRDMKNELLKRGSYNVILVDWTWGNNIDPTIGNENTKPVGEQMAFVVNNIVAVSGQRPEDIHIVGHSYGTQVAAYAGRRIENLGRITLLDPFFPHYYHVDSEFHYIRDYAGLVDVIHSNAGNCFALVELVPFGPVGHADFYPDGGRNFQESCVSATIAAFLKLDIFYGVFSLDPNGCSHLQAVQFYKATINPNGCDYTAYECPNYEDFLAGKCSSCGENGNKCAQMGMHIGENFQNNQNSSRSFYLKTELTCPYCSIPPNMFAPGSSS